MHGFGMNVALLMRKDTDKFSDITGIEHLQYNDLLSLKVVLSKWLIDNVSESNKDNLRGILDEGEDALKNGISKPYVTIRQSSGNTDPSDVKERIEDNIDLPLPSATIFQEKQEEVKAINFLIETHFELSRTLPKQKLLELLRSSRIRINQSGFLYPFLDKEPRMLKTDVLLFNDSEDVPHSREVNKVALFAYDKLTIAQLLRHFRWGFDVPRFLDAELINYQAIMFFIFSTKLALNLNLPHIKFRLRLFDLQGCSLKTDSMFIGHQNYFAPYSNEIELKQNLVVGAHDSDRQDLQELLMLLWDNFQSPSGSSPKLFEKEYFYIYDEVVNLNKKS